MAELGMTIAKKIVKEHMGGIRIISKPGTGSEIIVEFPYREIEK